MTDVTSKGWAHIHERGTYIGLRILLFIYSVIGSRALGFVLYFIVGFYFIFCIDARKASLGYLRRIHVFMGDKSPWKKLPNLGHSFAHFMVFGRVAADKIIVWLGHYKNSDITFSGYDAYTAVKEQGQGTLLIASHLGNVDICRAIGGGLKGLPLTVLVYNAHAPNFQRVLSEVTGQVDNVELIDVSGITPDIAMRLQDKIHAGEHIIITGDRTAVDSNSRYEIVPFLGQDAAFAQGPFILGGLLDCPVFLLFSMKQKGGYHIFFEQFSDSLKSSRKARAQNLKCNVQAYAKRLEHYACAYPLQWFNFYDYWALPDNIDSE